MQSLAKCRHAVSYRRTLDHLRAWSLQLPNSVNEAVVTFHANDSDHTGTV